VDAGAVCLQGGRELTAGCEAMDADVLARTGPRVVVLAGAARPGEDYAGASARASGWYAALGAEVRVAPDPREDRAGTLAALVDVDLVVLPGGSPASLRQVLTGPIGDRVRELHAAGVGLSGASAGAMVLCQRMVLPSQGRREVDGLGLVPGMALVHWSGPERGRPPGDGWIRWGLPERGGVLVVGGAVRAVGQGEPSWLRHGRWAALPRDAAVPLP
jgi:hypothetical protein